VSKVPELLDADRCTLFLVDRETKELYVNREASSGRRRTMMSWIRGIIYAPALPFKEDEVRFPMHKGIAGHVATKGMALNIKNAHRDPRFNPSMDKATGYHTRTILCMPMKDANGDIIGVIQAINKHMSHFTPSDEYLLATFSAQAAVAVKNSQLFESTQVALDQSDALLEVANRLSKELKTGSLLQLIVSKLQTLLHAERCTVYLVNSEKRLLYTNKFMTHGMGPSLPINQKKDDMIRFPIGTGIAGIVAQTGQVINIADAYDHPQFNRSYDKKTGFRTRSVLCMPIRNSKNEIIGVSQVIIMFCESLYYIITDV